MDRCTMHIIMTCQVQALTLPALRSTWELQSGPRALPFGTPSVPSPHTLCPNDGLVTWSDVHSERGTHHLNHISAWCSMQRMAKWQPVGSSMYCIRFSGAIPSSASNLPPFPFTGTVCLSSFALPPCPFMTALRRKNLAAPSSKKVVPIVSSLMAHTTSQPLVSCLKELQYTQLYTMGQVGFNIQLHHRECCCCNQRLQVALTQSPWLSLHFQPPQSF